MIDAPEERVYTQKELPDDIRTKVLEICRDGVPLQWPRELPR